MNAIRKLISPDKARQVLSDVAKRFPFPLAFISALVAWLIIMVYECTADYRVVNDSVTWALFEGFLLSLAVGLWCEFMGWKKVCGRAQIGVLAIVVLDFTVLCLRGGVSGSAEFTGRAAFTVALASAVFFMPAVRRLHTRQLWRYTMWQLYAVAIAAFIGAVMAVSCLIIFSSVNILFGLDEYKPMVTALCVLGVWVPAVVFLSHAPHFEDVSSDRFDYSSPAGAFCKNILLPLVAVYTVILYVYAAKILFEWKLPNASVAWMVSGLMCASLIVLYGLQRYSFGGDSAAVAVKIWRLVRRLLPIILLPLLVLMSVGLAYRVGEYGITVSRLYVAAFNVWAYAVVLYLILKKKANLNLVAASFAVVFALVSMIPGLNFTSVADRMIRSEVISSLSANGVDAFPISEEKFTEILSGMNRKDAENLASRVEYLDDWNDHSRVCDIVRSDDKLSVWRIMPDVFSDSYEVETVASLPFVLECSGAVAIPDGFSKVHLNETYGNQHLSLDSCGFATVEYGGYSAKINVDSLLTVKTSDSPLVCNAENAKGEEACFVFTDFVIDDIEADSASVIVRRPKCYIFTR